GKTFTTTKAGEDRIYIHYNGKAIQSFPVTIVDGPSTLSVNGSKEVMLGGSQTYSIDAKDASGKNLIYNADQVKWSVNGEIGTITQSGQFTATKAGKGQIVATLGNKSASISVEVKELQLFEDVTSSYP